MKIDWKKHQYPRIQDFLKKYWQTFLHNNSFANLLDKKMKVETGTNFYDWIDTVIFPFDMRLLKKLEKLGFTPHPNISQCWEVKDASLPFIFVKENHLEIILKVDSLTNFLLKHKLFLSIDGEVHSSVRKVSISNHQDYILSIKESCTVFPHTLPTETSIEDFCKYLKALDLWKNRSREFNNTQEGVRQTLALAYRIVDMVGVNCAADIVLKAEREYWQYNSPIADLQKFFQDKLGLGWGNCDHYTFWSGRENFKALIQIFEVLGFRCTKNFFISKFDGVGTQVLEHLHCKILVVCEVRLKKSEAKLDFAHTDLPSIGKKGVLDNWVKKHGESILEAGAKQIGIKCDVAKIQNYMSLYKIPFVEQENNPFFKLSISGQSIYYDGYDNYLSLVERSMCFKYFYSDFIDDFRQSLHSG